MVHLDRKKPLHENYEMSSSYDSLNVRFGMTVSMFRKYVIGMTPVIIFFMRPSENSDGKYVETNERDQCHENG